MLNMERESSLWPGLEHWAAAPLRPPIAVYQATTGASGYYPTEASNGRQEPRPWPRLAPANTRRARQISFDCSLNRISEGGSHLAGDHHLPLRLGQTPSRCLGFGRKDALL